MKVGIVGFGKMGKLFAEKFSEKCSINVYTKGLDPGQYMVYDDLQNFYHSSKYIMISTPMNETKKLIMELSAFSSEEKRIVFDICSFKTGLKEVYASLSEHNHVCSVHPMFGSGVSTLTNKNVILTPMNPREEDIFLVENFFKDFGMNVTRLDPHNGCIAGRGSPGRSPGGRRGGRSGPGGSGRPISG
ncbi:MAG: prephenate dehydrogenase/arogenate dehydrogenase family protein [Thermoplasmata archaeon]